MAQLINVDGSDDPSYRYKMPRIVSKVEGRGNGVKTVLVNCSDVAQALHRSSAQLTKYFGCELGAMTKYEEKIERALVNGAFENKVLQEALTGYIEKFVLCPSCNNPETVQEIKGKKKHATILLNCKACGACEPSDNEHKLVTFIIKEVSADDKPDKKKKKKDKSSKKKDRGGSDSVAGSDDVSDKSTGKEKEKKKKKSKKSKKSKRIDNEEEKEDGDAASTDEDLEEFGSITVHDVAALDSSIDKVVGLVNAESPDETIIEAVREQQVNSGLLKTDQLPILFFSLLQSNLKLPVILEKLDLLKHIKPLFKDKEHWETEVMLCVEEVVARQEAGEKRDSMRKIVPLVLKGLYDLELLDESGIVSWYEGKLDKLLYTHRRCVVTSDEVKLIKQQAKPIITWLQEAESDDDTDEEEDSD